MVSNSHVYDEIQNRTAYLIEIARSYTLVFGCKKASFNFSLSQTFPDLHISLTVDFLFDFPVLFGTFVEVFQCKDASFGMAKGQLQTPKLDRQLSSPKWPILSILWGSPPSPQHRQPVQTYLFTSVYMLHVHQVKLACSLSSV